MGTESPTPEKKPSPALIKFGAEMRRMREAAGLTQTAVARRLGCTQTQVSRLEQGKRMPSRSNAEKLDELYGLTERKYFVNQYRRILAYPAAQAWYLDWVDDIEPVALVLRTWDPVLVPGLLQTEAYAREIFRQEPRITPEEVEDRVQARLQRQKIFARKNPASLLAMLDEQVLRRQVGDRRVMREQFEHLLAVSHCSTISIQIVDARCLVGALGTFIIAELPDGEPDTILADSAAEGQVSSDPEVVSAIWGRYDAIRLWAYPEHVSRKMIEAARRHCI